MKKKSKNPTKTLANPNMQKCMADMMKGGKSPKEASMICKGMNNK